MAEKRLGFGEPVTLDGAQADLLRRVLERGVVYPGITNDLNAYESLCHTAIPMPEVCQVVRETITRTDEVFGNIETLPDVDDPRYEQFCSKMSNLIVAARDAFDTKPEGCEMEVSGDDSYSCRRCFFDVNLDYI